MFLEQINRVPSVIPDYQSYPGIGDRTAWTQITDRMKGAILDDAAKAATQLWPSLPLELYRRYSETGNRVDFETPYFQRRRILNSLVMGECVSGNREYLESIVEGLSLICNETGWQLPAHNSLVRDKPSDPLPITDPPVVDIFAAETGALLAVAITVLESSIGEVNEPIDAELRKRIIDPYLNHHYWWMGKPGERMNNWTVWCTQNVLLVALLRPLDQTLRSQVIQQAARSLDFFLKDYGEDGACVEGPYYYHHAGLCLLQCLSILSSVAPEAFLPLWQEEKIRNIAEFITHVHVSGHRYMNFSDSPAVVHSLGVREFLFGSALESESLKQYGWQCWCGNSQATQPEEINLFYRLQAAFTDQQLSEFEAGKVTVSDSYFPSIGLLTASDSQYKLAVKAGCNDNSGHNHNDVGNVILYKNDRPVLIDLGNENYTSKTFSSERYDIWVMQSAFHNLPTFSGVMQKDGAEFAARDVTVQLEDNKASISMDIAGAYPAAANVRCYSRSVQLLKNRGVEIIDRTVCESPAELSLMFAEKPIIKGVSLQLDGQIEMKVEGATQIELDTIEVSDERLRLSWGARVYRLRLLFADTLKIVID